MKMIHRFASIAALLFVATFCMGVSQCNTTGNFATDAAAVWNSPSVQAELTQVQTLAFNFVNAFLTSHLGGNVRLSVQSPSVQMAVETGVAQIKAAHPNVPDSVIRSAIKADFADKLK